MYLVFLITCLDKKKNAYGFVIQSSIVACNSICNACFNFFQFSQICFVLLTLKTFFSSGHVWFVIHSDVLLLLHSYIQRPFNDQTLRPYVKPQPYFMKLKPLGYFNEILHIFLNIVFLGYKRTYTYIFLMNYQCFCKQLYDQAAQYQISLYDVFSVLVMRRKVF